jgi:hypothetical protein
MSSKKGVSTKKDKKAPKTATKKPKSVTLDELSDTSLDEVSGGVTAGFEATAGFEGTSST